MVSIKLSTDPSYLVHWFQNCAQMGEINPVFSLVVNPTSAGNQPMRNQDSFHPTLWFIGALFWTSGLKITRISFEWYRLFILVDPGGNRKYTGCSIKKVTKYWAVKPIKNVILRLSKSLKLPKIWDILITSQVFSKGGLKFPFKASRSQIPKYLIFHNTGYKIFT